MNNSVHKFYNSKSWLSDSNGNFFDAIAYEDLRKCSNKYLKNNRLGISEIKLDLPNSELIPFLFLSREDMRGILPNNFITKFLLKIIILFKPYLLLFLIEYFLIRLKGVRN